MRFQDKVVVLTGVGRQGQVGEAVGRAFASEGARVVAVSRLESEAEARAAELRRARRRGEAPEARRPRRGAGAHGRRYCRVSGVRASGISEGVRQSVSASGERRQEVRLSGVSRQLSAESCSLTPPARLLRAPA